MIADEVSVHGAGVAGAAPAAVVAPPPSAAPARGVSASVDLRAALPHAAVIAAALASWIVAVTGADLSRISGFGLLSALGPLYFLGLGLLACGFAVAATRTRAQPIVLGAYVIALVVMLHATAALLYSEPRYD